MLENYTHMTFLLDSSASMRDTWGKTITGMKKLVAEQQSIPGIITYSLYEFNSYIRRLCHFTKSCEGIDTIIPNGMTALYDAFKQSTTEVGQHLSSLPESLRPSKVIYCTITDGEENSSRNTSLQEVQNILSVQEKVYSWDFTFLGANFNAKGLAANLKIDVDKSWIYKKGAEAIAFENYSQSLTSYRGGSSMKAAMAGNESKVV